MYISNTGEIEIGEIINIHYDDTPPYYTIKLNRTGNEKVTDEKNLTILDEIEEINEIEEDNNEQQKEEENKLKNKKQQENKNETITSLIVNSKFSMKWIIGISILLSLGTLVSYNYLRNSYSIFSKSKK